MTRIVRFHRIGGPEVLQLDDLDIGQPKAQEVRIRVRALGLNRAEAMFRSGAYLEAPTLPARLGYEAAGEVEAVGPDVTGFAVGDAVSTIPSFSMNHYGVYGESAIVPVHAVARHPANLSWSEAAAIWMQYLTVYGALVEISRVAAGDAVVITAASSSVGLAAIQIVNRLGGLAIAATRTRAKRDALMNAGARHVVVTEDQDLAKEVLQLTDGKGAGFVFDPIGGRGVEALAAAAAPGGTLYLYGALAREATPFPLFAAIGKNLVVRGYTLFSLVARPESLERAKCFVVDGLADGSLKPVIAASFPLKDIVQAHRYLESNQQVGKVVVTV